MSDINEAKKPGTPNPGTPADGRLKTNKGKGGGSTGTAGKPFGGAGSGATKGKKK